MSTSSAGSRWDISTDPGPSWASSRWLRQGWRSSARQPGRGLAGSVPRFVLATLTPAKLRGIGLEAAWSGAALVCYPTGVFGERPPPSSWQVHHRTDSLSPARRALLMTDMTAAGIPILLLHGLGGNRSVFGLFRQTLRRRGFDTLHAVNFTPLIALTGDIRLAAHQLGEHVDRLRERIGCEQVHVIGHSLGGLIARYYVQRLGGDQAVHSLATLGSPHGGSLAAYLLPTGLAAQLRPGSPLLSELARPAPDCRTRFLVVWSRLDQLIIPQTNGQLTHPDLIVDTLEVAHVGHLSLPMDPRTAHWVASSLARLDPTEFRSGHEQGDPGRIGQRQKPAPRTCG